MLDEQIEDVRLWITTKMQEVWPTISKINVDMSKVKQGTNYGICRLMDDIDIENKTPCADWAFLAWVIVGVFTKEGGEIEVQQAIREANRMRLALLESTDVAGVAFNPQVTKIMTETKSDYGDNLYEAGLIFQCTVETDRVVTP